MLIEAVIFDMDGLMLDTEPAYRRAWQEAAAGCGYVLSQALYLRLFGHNRHDAEQILVAEFGADFPLDVFRAACRNAEALEFGASRLQKKRGLDELLKFLDSLRVRKAVATSTERKMAVQLLTTTGLLAQFDVLATGDEVANGKPSPEIFLLAAQRLGVSNSGCLVLEDAEPGVIAASRAGMQVFVVPDQKTPSPEVQRLASGIFDSLADVARHLELASEGSAQLKS